MLVCALDGFKKGWRHSNEVKQKNTVLESIHHILMLVYALDLFKKGWRHSNEVIKRKTLFWSEYQSLKRHEIIFHEEKPYFDVCLCSRSIQEGFETFWWSHKQKNTILESIPKFEKTQDHFSWRENHILMLVCALDPFKKGWRHSNEVINRKTPF